MTSRTYVLVHGAYHGGWCWAHVAARLRALGHVVHAPTLTGLGERSHLLACDPSLRTFTQDVAQVILYEDLSDVVLVGHSFGGSPISGVADQMAQRLRHLVYLDAQVLLPGETPASRTPPEVIEGHRQRVRVIDGVQVAQPADPASFGITDAEMAAWVQSRLTPHPFRTYFDPLELDHPLANGVPATYIACTEPMRPRTASSRQRARDLGWRCLDIPTGHDAMLTMPAELTQMLASIG